MQRRLIAIIVYNTTKKRINKFMSSNVPYVSPLVNELLPTFGPHDENASYHFTITTIIIHIFICQSKADKNQNGRRKIK